MRPGSNEAVLPIGACLLHDDVSNKILALVEEQTRALKLLPHNHPTGKVREGGLLLGALSLWKRVEHKASQPCHIIL